jgi:predicted P-loop ATPase
MGKAENADLKAFLTRAEERFTPKYGRKEVVEPRQCIFIGTTNNDSYLRDETGGRRFWPVKAVRIDTEALSHDRDQLFAEAVAAFRKGERWWPDQAFEQAHIKPQQEERFEEDAWQGPINGYLAGKSQTTMVDVALEALALDRAKLGHPEQKRIRVAIERAGWKSGPKSNKGRLYVPAEVVTP